MLRCVTASKETLISTSCDSKTVSKLVKAHQVFCPNCGGDVVFKNGSVNISHFAHRVAECNYVGHEPETKSHIKGKSILYEWLKDLFPTAFVQYEVHIPSTGQIADVYIEHNDGEHAGLKWAFEFQHSPITIAQWKERNSLYESVGIQDFWIFDKAKFMKFSSARDFTDARRRVKFDEHVYNETGLVYFLDLEKVELTIEFNFTMISRTTLVDGYNRKQNFTYHDPRENSVPISSVRVRKSRTFDYSVLVTDCLEPSMENRLSYIYTILEKKDRRKREALYLKKLKEKGEYARTTYGDKFTDRFKEIITDSNGEFAYYQSIFEPDDDFYDKELGLLREDVINLNMDEFFFKYKSIVKTSVSNSEDYKKFQTSDDISLRVLTKYANFSDFERVGFLKKQGGKTLQEYLASKHKDQVALVVHVYINHRDTLGRLGRRNGDYVNEMLLEISRGLPVYGSSRTPMDYAMEYRNLNTIDDVESCITQIKKKLYSHDPLSDE